MISGGTDFVDPGTQCGATPLGGAAGFDLVGYGRAVGRRVSRLAFACAVLLAGWLIPGASNAQEPDDVTTVAVRVLEPFVVDGGDGELQGFSVDLAREIARLADLEIEFVIVDTVGEQIESVVAGDTDAAIGAISITAEREAIVDFSQPMFESGIQIAVPNSTAGPTFATVLGQVFQPFLAVLVGVMFLGTLVVGCVVWVIERRRNPDFQERGLRGIFHAIWWASVTLFTVGYGDAVPRRGASRAITILWMLGGVLLVATLTAEVTAEITVDRLDSGIESVSDLYGKEVLTIAGATSDDFLRDAGIVAEGVADPEEAFLALERDEADAFVYDAAIIQYLVAETDGVRVAGPVLRPESYGIVLPEGSPAVEALDQALLELRENGSYDRLVRAYFE
jgi:polar amino acid transport system substrate-binding protein